MDAGNSLNVEARARARRQAAYCKVFSSATRILIIWALRDHERCVSDIAEHIASSVQNTSQHLRLMEDKHILCSRRAGKLIYYRIAEPDPQVGCPLLAAACAEQRALQDSTHLAQKET